MGGGQDGEQEEGEVGGDRRGSGDQKQWLGGFLTVATSPDLHYVVGVRQERRRGYPWHMAERGQW